MIKLNNGSQVAIRPTPTSTVGTPGYFTENNDQGAPSYPGKDWFNDLIDELLNALNAVGVTYNHSIKTNIANALLAPRNASNFDTGTVPLARLPTGSGKGLDADKLDGQEGSYYRNASNLNAGTVPLARLPTGSGKGLDADKLDGQEGSYYRNASNLNAGTVPLARLPIKLATTEEIAAGVSDSVYITPKGLTEAGVFADFVGSVHFFATNIPPAGFIKSNDTLLLIEDFPELYAKFGTAYGGDGITTFGNLDVRGDFIRALDDGRGVDVGRVLGSWQADELKSHSHPLGTNSRDNGGDQGSTMENSTGTTRTNYTGNYGGTETRPRNSAFIAYIKY